MTQRIFDVENEKDMQDLWDILPDWADKITKGENKKYDVIWNTELHASYRCLIKINWHDKTEITRLKNYESMIGCVGWFANHKNATKDDMIFGKLDKYNKNDGLGRCFYCHCDTWYKYFLPAEKCDVKFYGVDKDE